MIAADKTATSRNDGVILAAEGLSKSFGGFRAVDGVSFALRHNSVHALIGPNGAGKTTLFNLLTKFLQPTSGRIRFEGRDITRMKPADVAKLGLVRSFQISAVFGGMSVLRNVRVALQQRRRRPALEFWKSNAVLDVLDEEAESLLALVGLSQQRDRPARELAYGQKRALEIATTLALDPKVLLLDEPMAGMGQEDIQRATNLIRQVSRDRTILMVEHNLSVVETLSDRISVLTRGQILVEGSYEEVSKDPRVLEAYIGTGHA